jgi:hypothetical protein
MNRNNWWDRLVTRKLKPQRRRSRPEIELLEARCLMDTGIRSITGFGNNVDHPTDGMGNTDLIRVSPVAYADGVSAPSTPNTINPRVISNNLSNQSNPIFSFNDNLGNPNSAELSDYAYAFGQFIDHDMDLTLDNSGQAFNIPADTRTFPGGITDPMTGGEPFGRSQFDASTGTTTPTTISVDLGRDFNRTGIVNDRSTFGSGFDGDGFALSAQLLGSSVTLNGHTFVLAAPGSANVIRAAGQAIEIGGASPATSLTFVAAGVNGNQFNQTFTVNYTDGTNQTFTQSISDWATPQNFSGETIVKTMPYRDFNNGGTQFLQVDVYGYTIPLNSAKTVQSVTLPNNGNVNVLAIDLSETADPRQQVNLDTSFLDLSQVYGSTNAVDNILRSHVGGQLRTSAGSFLPRESDFTAAELATLNHDEGGIANDAMQVPNSELFVAGDKRVNENVELMSQQTLFMRNHNRLASQLQSLHPGWTDEQLFQEARKLNIAEYQNIVFNGYVPSIVGANAVPTYTGYNPNVNAAISTEFSTVGFRFGHSLLSTTVGRDNNDGTGITDVSPNGSPINLTEDFFRPDLLNNNHVTVNLTDRFGNPDPHTSSTVGEVLKALADGLPNEFDLQLIDEVRTLLFGIPNGPGTDLAARDVQRARDHGIGTYNEVRVAYGLAPVTTFAQISSDPAVQAALQATYGSVNNVDPFMGMLAEDIIPGSDVGPTVQAILVDQFSRLRDGDRFYFQNESFNSEEQSLLAQGDDYADVISNNTSITNLQGNVFFNRLEISGTVFNDPDGNGVRETGEAGIHGVTVELHDAASGDLISSTVTDANGEYDFTELGAGTDGTIPGTGNFTLKLIVPPGFTQNATEIAHNPGEIFLSRGDLQIDGQDFAIMSSRAAPAFAGGGSSSSGASASPVGVSGADSTVGSIQIGPSSAASSGTGSQITVTVPPSTAQTVDTTATGLGTPQVTSPSTPTSPSSGSSTPTRSSSGANTGVDPSSVGGAQAGTTSSVSNQGVVPSPSSSSSGQSTSLTSDDPSNPLP